MVGQKGHCAIFDWKSKSLKCEFNVKETVRDIKFLLDENLYALAQKKYVLDREKRWKMKMAQIVGAVPLCPVVLEKRLLLTLQTSINV